MADFDNMTPTSDGWAALRRLAVAVIATCSAGALFALSPAAFAEDKPADAKPTEAAAPVNPKDGEAAKPVAISEK